MNHRILVIDDNPAIHADIRKILGKQAHSSAFMEDAEAVLFGDAQTDDTAVLFEIDSAYQGQEGLEKIQQSLVAQNPYALAFVDVRMPPGWDGIETISRIWEVYPELQVVICTAYSDYSWEEMTRRVHKSDSVLILKKPFDNIEVLQMAHALTKKWFLTHEAKSQLTNLDRMVSLRTEELQQANQRLTLEISERSQAEDQLRLSEERFAKAFKSSPIPMCILSIEQQRYLDVNDSYIEMTGYSRGELLGRSALDLNLWPNVESRTEILRQLTAGRAIRNLESHIRTKIGHERTTLLSAELITLGIDAYALISEHDISQRLQLEAQLRQAQKMEAIGHLAAGVAHDFRNILTVILGHANLRLMSKGLDEKVTESLRQISEAAQRASNLTRQLLAFSRKQIIQLQAIDLNDLIAQLSSMLVRLIGEHITLDCRYDHDLPFTEADSCSIEQILMNLVVNARDAMPEGGRLTISTSLAVIDTDYVSKNSEATPGKYVCMTVVDTGCGMDDATMERLFEPFFTTKEVGKGTGMGLATVYGIVKQHNGWSEVTSQPGHGTTFKVYIPASDRKQPPAEKKNIVTRDFAGDETILIVEDEEPVRRFVSDLLQEYGYQVRIASSGLEALRVWREHSGDIDLLLTDVVMPESISGLQLAEKLLADKQSLKVIYTSGYSIELLDTHFQSRTRVNFLPKPYHPLKLAEAVRECLDT
ncbi:MAG: multi-sensor hybrid histidine kinase [Verrucomicrobiales bacterium]|nr:multi-sensor hybrid histidine kinase [Verrucomicrobiales bacterium]